MSIILKTLLFFLLLVSHDKAYGDKFSQELKKFLKNSGSVCFFSSTAPFLCDQRNHMQRLMNREIEQYYNSLSAEDKKEIKKLAEQIKAMPEYKYMGKLNAEDDNVSFQDRMRANIAITAKITALLNECAKKENNVNKCLALHIFLIELLQGYGH